MKLASLLAIIGLLLKECYCDKDDSYYIAGTGNPNVNSKMYWKDTDNIFQDLSQFSTLYVEFHHCSWTWMQQEEADNNVDENDYWYMGKIPPMGANVAFSLYGSLKGQTFSGCNKDSFISSFYTNSGFDAFSSAMYKAGVSGFSKYFYMSSSDGSSQSSQYLTAKCMGGYGVGCDSSNGFAVHTYATSECDPQQVTGVKDTLYSLNKAMGNAKCIKIYDRSRSSDYTEGTAMDLLANSHSCFYQDVFSPDGECPDPYGILYNYQKQFHKGIQESRRQDPFQVYVRRREYSDKLRRYQRWTYAGASLFMVAAFLLFLDYCSSRRIFHTAMSKRKINKSSSKGQQHLGDDNDPPGVFKLDQLNSHHDYAAFDGSITNESGNMVNTSNSFNVAAGEVIITASDGKGSSPSSASLKELLCDPCCGGNTATIAYDEEKATGSYLSMDNSSENNQVGGATTAITSSISNHNQVDNELEDPKRIYTTSTQDDQDVFQEPARLQDFQDNQDTDEELSVSLPSFVESEEVYDGNERTDDEWEKGEMGEATFGDLSPRIPEDADYSQASIEQESWGAVENDDGDDKAHGDFAPNKPHTLCEDEDFVNIGMSKTTEECTAAHTNTNDDFVTDEYVAKYTNRTGISTMEEADQCRSTVRPVSDPEEISEMLRKAMTSAKSMINNSVTSNI